MNTGPNVNAPISSVTLENCNYVQEKIIPVGITYGLLSYMPINPRSVQLSINGSVALQGEDYIIDGRKLQFTPPLQAANDVVVAIYPTISPVADIPAIEIDFDIPGQSARLSPVGNLQILVDGMWYDLIPTTDPIAGTVVFVPDQEPSLNQ
jgi:hypothetical protein